MANQDSGFIQLTGDLSVEITPNVITESSISFLGTLDSTIDGESKGAGFISFSGSGGLSIEPDVYTPVGKITFAGSLSAEISTQNLVNSFSAMYGFLTAKIGGSKTIYCSELTLDMAMQTIESVVCSIKGEGMKLIRFRGDNYPVKAVLGIAGITDTTGLTFKMSTQIEGGAVHTVAGVITDAVNGRVSFTLPTEAVAVAGSGFYDIESNDGTYTYTYEKGVFTLLPDLTP